MMATHGNAAWQALSDDDPSELVDVEASEKVLERVGLFNRERVRQVADRSKPLTPAEVRRASVRIIRKMSRGCKGLPDYAVQTMYGDYQAGMSLAEVGAAYNRTRQSIYQIFKAAGLQLRARQFKKPLEWGGLRWTQTDGHHYRPTRGDYATRELRLHRCIWEKHHGPIPAGHQVTFKDGNWDNFEPDNLVCLPIAECTLLHYRRRYPERAAWTAEQLKEFHRAHNRDFMRAKTAGYVAKGLRSDGKPRRRNFSQKATKEAA